MSRLETILEQMRSEEMSHLKADDLLIRTIRVLGGNAGEKALAEDIIDAYEDVKERDA